MRLKIFQLLNWPYIFQSWLLMLITFVSMWSCVMCNKVITLYWSENQWKVIKSLPEHKTGTQGSRSIIDVMMSSINKSPNSDLNVTTFIFHRWDFNTIMDFFQRFRLDDVENQGNYLVLGQVSPEDEGVSAMLMSQSVD